MKVTDDSTITCTIMRMSTVMPRTKVLQGQGPLKVLSIRSYGDLSMIQQRDFISQFHVVLASASVPATTQYADYIKQASGGTGLLMGGKLVKLGEAVEEWCENQTSFEKRALCRQPALFDVIFWRRVVFDEFHESEAWEYRVREMLRGLRATHKWGLSGTPPLGGPFAVAEVAGLLGYTRPRVRGDVFGKALFYAWTRQRQRSCQRWQAEHWFAAPANQDRLKAQAERFVAEYIRQNTSELIERIGIVEHEELVEHTPAERMIYRQACHDRGVFELTQGYSHVSLHARAELLKRCAHFDMGERAAESAMSAVNTLGQRKRDRVGTVERQLWIEVARTKLFRAWDSTGKEAVRSARVQHPDAQALVDRLLSSSVEDVERRLAQIAPVAEPADPESGPLTQSLRATVKLVAQDGALRVRPEVRLVQPIPEHEYYRDDRKRHVVVHAVARRAQNKAANEALAEMAVCEHACGGGSRLDVASCLGSGLSKLVALLEDAHRSLQFYTQQLNSLTRQEDDEETACSICLESTRQIGTAAILPCSHVFHAECIRAALAQNPLCPECRTPVERSQISSMVMELRPPEPKPEGPPAPHMSMAWKRNGSKLNAVAERLRTIRRQDPKAKALVFVQWTDLEAKVWCALQDHGVPFLRLSTWSSGGLGGEDAAVLRRFQDDDRPDAPFVLVLSLQRAAAGTNLTSASHVLFVHPMNAETVATAAAYERQALARVRRIGQTRREVHVWRFVTKQTVEEHIWKLHRNAHEEAEADDVDE